MSFNSPRRKVPWPFNTKEEEYDYYNLSEEERINKTQKKREKEKKEIIEEIK